MRNKGEQRAKEESINNEGKNISRGGAEDAEGRRGIKR